MQVRSSFAIVYVDGFVGELRHAGVTVLADPADQVWGERVAYVEDPDGNPVHIRGSVLTPEKRSE